MSNNGARIYIPPWARINPEKYPHFRAANGTKQKKMANPRSEIACGKGAKKKGKERLCVA